MSPPLRTASNQPRPRAPHQTASRGKGFHRPSVEAFLDESVDHMLRRYAFKSEAFQDQLAERE